MQNWKKPLPETELAEEAKTLPAFKNLVVRAKSAAGFISGPHFNASTLGQRSGQPGGGILSQNDLYQSLCAQLSGKFSPHAMMRFGDAAYYCPTHEEMKIVLRESTSEIQRWTPERFDCDDFSYVFKGDASLHAYKTPEFQYALCVGIIWGDFSWVNGFHAVNWFMDHQGVLWLVEPQGDQVYAVSECRGNVDVVVV